MRLVYFYFCFILCLNLGFSTSFISEIDFGYFEFVEIFSNESLNLTQKKVYDENLDKFNELNLLQQRNSSYYLIVGQKFIESNNLSDLNCSIYVTDKSQVSNGGLKGSGEDLIIEINSSSNLSYLHNENFEFSENQSLNFNSSSNFYYVANKSICGLNAGFERLDENNSANNSKKVDLVHFELEIEDFLVFDKVIFDFDTNVSNFTIKYWIEDYLGNVVKKKRDTTNLNSKSWSPKGITNVYVVKGILEFENQTLNVSKMFYYYSNETYLVKVEDGDIKEEKEVSKIIIKNKNDLLNEKTTSLKYEIYKGNTLKRTVYFYLNGEKIHSINLNKYSYLGGTLDLKPYLILGENQLLIKGLELEVLQVFKVNNVFSNDLKSFDEDFKSKELYFSSIYQNSSVISFDLFSRLENKNVFCYVNSGKSIVSNELNFKLDEKKYNLRLMINNSKLRDKNFQNGDFLKLICKYNQSKYFKYLSEEFNYFFPKEINTPIISSAKINFYTLQNNDSKSDYVSNLSSEINLVKENSLQNNSVQIISSNLKVKEKSFQFLFAVLVLIVCILILRW